MGAHTPRLWQCEEMGSEGWTVFAKPYMRVLAMNLSKADAFLIVAAPQLLEALRECRAVIETYRAFGHMPTTSVILAANDAARAAIKAATE